MVLTFLRARAPRAPGLRRIRWVMLPLVLHACTPVGQPATGPEAPPPDPPIEAGGVSSTAEATAAARLGAMQRALQAGDWEAARRAAQAVVDSFPRAPGSSRALFVLARAALETGDTVAAAGPAERFERLVGAGDPRAAEARLWRAWARLAEGRPEAAVRLALTLPATAPSAARDGARALLQRTVESLAGDALAEAATLVDPPPAWAAPVLAEYALQRFLAGDTADATRWARAALERGAGDRARAVAEAVLSGDVSAFAGFPPLGAILPLTGSPALRRFARAIQEGVEVALDPAGGLVREGRAPELLIRDDRGAPDRVAALVAGLEEAGAVGV
ncbi:MAG: hypothetical protein D6701_01235, partial [Gemmatimonadetes bacterium]